jgi:hypothetical protein
LGSSSILENVIDETDGDKMECEYGFYEPQGRVRLMSGLVEEKRTLRFGASKIFFYVEY